MKNLLIMRHAKSDWENSNLSDFDRPLNDRGNKAAPLMAEEIIRLDKLPQIIISSPANRAKSTAQLFAKKIGIENDIIFERNFYSGYIDDIVEFVKSVDDKFSRIMIVGHNPTMESLVSYLINNRPYIVMSTAAIASINFDIKKWSKLKFGTGSLEWLIKPKDLQNL
ncbi:MAG: histidine phosphatase family protein [Bacteroidales bacterium]|nr:histidine phosphatase family protein [Bacteroidales bacterium]